MNKIVVAFVVSSGLAGRLALAQDPGEKKGQDAGSAGRRSASNE